MRDLTRPTEPSRAVQARMAAETAARAGVVGPAAALAESDGTPSGDSTTYAVLFNRW